MRRAARPPSARVPSCEPLRGVEQPGCHDAARSRAGRVGTIGEGARNDGTDLATEWSAELGEVRRALLEEGGDRLEVLRRPDALGEGLVLTGAGRPDVLAAGRQEEALG